GIRTVHWDIVRHGNICGGEPVMGKAIKSVWKYRGQSTFTLRAIIAGKQHPLPAITDIWRPDTPLRCVARNVKE
ncbi:hypothetical protein, partial [Klebsiella michiganensis]|uniref:hypothetical protein n=1 Tax=Klebsiella michiganensis TaxID=1134687 RepID=UPI001C499076